MNASTIESALYCELFLAKHKRNKRFFIYFIFYISK